MYTEKYLNEKLKSLREKDPYIHISIKLEKPHVSIANVRVKLIGVYAHIFQVEEETESRKIIHSMQYGDINAGIVKIAEMN